MPPSEEKFKEVQNAYDTLSDPEKRKQYDSFGAANGRPGFDPRNFDFGRGGGGNFNDQRSRRSRRPLRWALRGPRRPRRQRPPPTARARLRRRGRGQPLVRGLAARTRDEDPGRDHDRLSRLRRQWRGARHGARDLSRVPRPRCRRREPGDVRALRAVPALPRERNRDREALPQLRRQRPRAADEALHGQDPRRSQERHARQAQGKGRGRRRRVAPQATCSSSRGSSPRSSSTAAEPISSSTCP